MDCQRSSAGSASAGPRRLAVDLQGSAISTANIAGSRPGASAQGLRPDDRDGREDRWKPSIQHDQEQAIPIRELDATAYPPLQHNQLMSEGLVLCLKSALWPAPGSEDTELGVLMELEVGHGETEVYPRVQA